MVIKIQAQVEGTLIQSAGIIILVMRSVVGFRESIRESEDPLRESL
jgi:hypothetical protein